MPHQSTISNQQSAINRFWPWAAAVLSGVLLTLCFAPWNQGWLCWIALTPLIAAAFSSGGPLKKAALGYVTGVIFFASTFWWLNTLAALYRNPLLLAIPVLLALFFGLYFAFWSWFVGAVLTRLPGTRSFDRSLVNLGIGAAGASAWLLHEWVRERLFGGFGWNPLGVALHRDIPMIQIAELTGVPGLSWLVIFTNLMAVIIIRRIIGELGPTFLKRVRWEFSATMALIAGVFTFGLRAIFSPDPAPTVPFLVTAIQPNVAQDEKFDRAADERVLREIDHLTSLALIAQPAPHLVLWPESAIPGGVYGSQQGHDFVRTQAGRGDFGLLFGTTDFDPAAGEDYNGALLLFGQAQQDKIDQLAGHPPGVLRGQFHRKMHLVPFGEYLPARPLLGPLVGGLIPGDFTPGTEFTLLDLPLHPPGPTSQPSPLLDIRLRLAPLVCFEDTLGDLTRRFVVKGADVLVNITNDGWFAQSPAAEQHLANAALRAVENRRPLIRCGNTGVTCLVLPSGHIERWLPPFQQGFAAREVRVATAARQTFYTRHGDWLTALSAAIVLLAGTLAWRAGSARQSLGNASIN